MTYLEDEEIKHAFGLPESTMAMTDVTGVDGDFRMVLRELSKLICNDKD